MWTTARVALQASSRQGSRHVPSQIVSNRCDQLVRYLSSQSVESNVSGVTVSQTKATKLSKSTNGHDDSIAESTPSTKDPLMSACGDVDNDNDSEMEQEEMYVNPHLCLGLEVREWGGPTRGGRLAEPTRYGDWERKGRCSDF